MGHPRGHGGVGDPEAAGGSFFPDWPLTHRRRAEQALVTVMATAYLLDVSTRRVERLAEQLGVKSLSRSQVSELAAHLALRSPPSRRIRIIASQPAPTTGEPAVTAERLTA